jgi:taurine dioxygenase
MELATHHRSAKPFVASFLDVSPVSPAIGAEVRDVDLATIDDATFQAIHAAWLQYNVLLFRNQNISDAELASFSHRFGELDYSPPNENGVMSPPEFAEILILSNVIEDGVAIGSLGNQECIWHTDMNYNEKPAKGSILYALEIPTAGGDTGFLNTYLTYDALRDELLEQIESLTIKHDSTTNSAGFRRVGSAEVVDIQTSPGVCHPIIRTHPETKRKTLYLGRRRYAYIPGLSLKESEALLDELWAHAIQEKFFWHHQWQVGDVVVWDNRCAMHRRDDFPQNERRIMHRTQIKGDKPY